MMEEWKKENLMKMKNMNYGLLQMQMGKLKKSCMRKGKLLEDGKFEQILIVSNFKMLLMKY